MTVYPTHYDVRNQFHADLAVQIDVKSTEITKQERCKDEIVE